MTYYTHINRGVIDANRKHGQADAPIAIKRGKRGKPTYAHEVKLPAGARLIYSDGEPLLPCGARCVIASDEAPEVIR